MNKTAIIEFFDHHAPQWDADMVRDEDVIHCILDNAGITPGVSVLDVACGTGVLIPDYLTRGVSSVTAVDISSEMIALAQQKFTQPNVHFLCADVECTSFPTQFDRIVIYNAWPHFFEPQKLIKKLADDLNPGGMLTVAHGMSRENINRHHTGSANAVSMGLHHEDELEEIFNPYLLVTTKISDEKMYQVVGEKR